MQAIENEIVGKTSRARKSGRRGELLIKLPVELQETAGIDAGTQFKTFFNHRGEVLFRPVVAEPAAAGGE